MKFKMNNVEYIIKEVEEKAWKREKESDIMEAGQREVRSSLRKYQRSCLTLVDSLVGK